LKFTKIVINNLFGITELELDGRNIELSGTNGSGKSSAIEAIRYALTNSSERGRIVRSGASEGSIIIETDTGLHIDRRKRIDKGDYRQVREEGRDIPAPETYLKRMFTTLQLNPVEFCEMTEAEQNRAILDLIHYEWDTKSILGWFGEIPAGVDYSNNILQVLDQIQSETGPYYPKRQEINRLAREKRASVASIAKDIPAGYDAARWESFDLAASYKALGEAQQHNARVEQARAFKQGYANKLRGLEASRDIAINAAEKASATDRSSLQATIARLKAELTAAEEKLAGLDAKLEASVKVIRAQHETAVTKLNADTDIAGGWAEKDLMDVQPIQQVITEAEAMKRHLNEYTRMKREQAEADALDAQSAALTAKIEKARALPGEILKTAEIPIPGLTVEGSTPLINGLPISNLSDGEKLNLCVDVSLSKPSGLQIILIDGMERLSKENREKLYDKCRQSGLQFIATRTTDSPDLTIAYL